MSCPNLNIHKSKKVIDVTHESKARITYCSIVLTTMKGWHVEPFACGSKK
jgi:hypothetical protein